jgi:type I restriction enzyme S subunit
MSDRLPKGWVETNLGAISNHPQYGWTCRSTKRGDFRLLRTTDISNGNIDWNFVPFCAQVPDQIEKFLVKRNDILVSRAGSVGISYLINERDLEYKSLFASYLIRFCPFIPAEFVFYYLKSYQYWRFISDSQLGIAVPNVNATKLAKLPFPLPPLNEQKRIVAKLDAIMPRIEAVQARLNEVPGILKRFRQSVLTAAVTGKLTQQWREEHPEVESAEVNFLKHHKESCSRNLNYNKSLKGDMPLQDIPSEWFLIKLSQTGDMGRGKSKHRPRNAPYLYGGEYPFIQTGDVANSNGFIKNHRQTYSEQGLKQSKLWPSSTICITIAANIADSAILTYPACFPDSVVGLIVNDKICDVRFVEFFIRTIRENLSLFAPATAQKNINLAILNDIMFPLPPLEEQKEIVRQVDKLFALADKVEAHYQKAKARVDKLSQSVLAKAFRGELVPQDPNDESAEKLLERILEEKARMETENKQSRKRGRKKRQ